MDKQGPPVEHRVSSQYPVINHNGKEYEKEYIHMKLSHFAVHLKLTQYCKLTILQFLKKVKKRHKRNTKKNILK